VALTYSGYIDKAQPSGTKVTLTLYINDERITIEIVGTQMSVISGTIVDNNRNVVTNDPGNVTTINGGDANSALDGTWINQAGEKWVFNKGRLTALVNNVESVKGTYSTNGRNITVLFVQFKGSMFGADASQYGISATDWYTKQQFRTVLIQYMVNAGVNRDYAATVVDGQLAQYPIFDPMTGQYSLSNNNNTLTIDSAVLTREGGTSGGGVDPSLVGTWVENGVPNSELTINSNGTYESIDNGDRYSGTITTSGNRFTMTLNGTPFTGTWSLSNNNNTLTLSSTGITGTFTRKGTGGGDDGQGNLLNGAWDRGDIVVTFNGNSGVFTEIKSNAYGGGWLIIMNNGQISIGDRKFRNITYKNNLTWTGQELIQNLTWANTTLTISGQTLRVETPNADPSVTTYTRVSDNPYEKLNGVWDRGDIVVTFNGSTGVFTEIKSGHWLIHLNAGRLKIGDSKFRNITKAGDLRWTAQELVGTSDNSGVGGFNNCTITVAANGQTLRVETPNADPSVTNYTKVGW
jgi:hypothetical protein